MVDLILAGSFVAVFYGGFKLGNKFSSLKQAITAGLNAIFD